MSMSFPSPDAERGKDLWRRLSHQSLRRHDPDQVPRFGKRRSGRVSALHGRQAARSVSQSLVGTPLGRTTIIADDGPVNPNPKAVTMDTRAAIAFEAGKELVVDTVQLEGPRAGEVLVELRATGLCHTDKYTLSGADPEGLFPAILGHEGAGVVLEVGPGVVSLKPGDHVIPLYTPECRECEYCLSPKTNLCVRIRSTQGKGLMPDGTSRFSYQGKPVLHYMGCSTFSNHTVLPEIALAKIRPDAPFDMVCYIGCGVTTGVGAVLFTAKVEADSTVVVFGLGGIGLNVIQGARMVGARRIVGVDTNPAREAMARRFGMTDFVNPKAVGGDLVGHLVELTGGGADYTFECVGNTTLMRQALECAHRGWGVATIIGVAASGQEITTRPFQLVTGRRWIGTAFGGARGRTDVPRIVDMFMDGRIQIDPLITHRLPLERINEGFELMSRGESIRTIVEY
jgi:S-(hydroxymethyl)glutathione dehydrogenase/alcohol dehydrogenase